MTTAPQERIASDDEIKAAIRNLTEEHGYAPTIREVCDRLGIRSTATLWFHLHRLRRRGEVSWVDNRSRTLHVTKARRRAKWRDD